MDVCVVKDLEPFCVGADWKCDRFARHCRSMIIKADENGHFQSVSFSHCQQSIYFRHELFKYYNGLEIVPLWIINVWKVSLEMFAACVICNMNGNIIIDYF